MFELPPAAGARMTQIEQSELKNRILSVLPAAEFASLSTFLEPVELELGQTLHRSGETIDHVYFVETGFISALRPPPRPRR
jgi:CRP-like cAMP-binding protein